MQPRKKPAQKSSVVYPEPDHVGFSDDGSKMLVAFDLAHQVDSTTHRSWIIAATRGFMPIAGPDGSQYYLQVILCKKKPGEDGLAETVSAFDP